MFRIKNISFWIIPCKQSPCCFTKIEIRVSLLACESFFTSQGFFFALNFGEYCMGHSFPLLIYPIKIYLNNSSVDKVKREKYISALFSAKENFALQFLWEKYCLGKSAIDFNTFYSSLVASYSEGPEDSPSPSDPHSELGEREIKRIEADTYCSINSPFVWCLPRDYNRAKHPFICKFVHIYSTDKN